jgi:hypothetical protein
MSGLPKKNTVRNLTTIVGRNSQVILFGSIEGKLKYRLMPQWITSLSTNLHCYIYLSIYYYFIIFSQVISITAFLPFDFCQTDALLGIEHCSTFTLKYRSLQDFPSIFLTLGTLVESESQLLYLFIQVYVSDDKNDWRFSFCSFWFPLRSHWFGKSNPNWLPSQRVGFLRMLPHF